MMKAKRITAKEVKAWMDKREPVFFIDARHADAWAHSDVKLPGARHILPDNIEQHLAKLPHDRAIVAYCT